MPFRYAYGLNNIYAIHVRVEFDEVGEIKQVFHQDFNIEYPILKVDKGRKEIIFQHLGTNKKYRIMY